MATCADGAAGAASSAAATSAGQQALLAEAGGGAVDPEIRRRIAEENKSLAAVEQALFTRLLKWREPNTLGATVDAQAEAERLRANRGERPAGDRGRNADRGRSGARARSARWSRRCSDDDVARSPGRAASASRWS